MQQIYVVHYHEIALKGKNRPMFLRALQENICRTTGLPQKWVKIVSGRIIVHCPTPHPRPLPQGEREIVQMEETIENSPPLVGGARGGDVRDALARVFGISSFSPAVLVEPKYAEIQKTLDVLLSGIQGKSAIVPSMALLPQFETFAIHATRGDKKFPLNSQELNIKLGAFVNKKFGKKVDLTNPDATFYVEVFSAQGGSASGGPGALIYTEKIPGPGGLPVGTQPKVAVMLSGGIDSPVAAYRIMKRGAPMVAIHFHSYPFTSRASIDKVKELVSILAKYNSGPIKLYLVPLAEAQKAVVQKTAEPYRVLLYRRLMVRIAQEFARKEGARALVTGEALGQVASQTVENIAVVEAVLHPPHPHPLPPNAPERSSVRGKHGEREIEQLEEQKRNSPPLVGGARGGESMPIFRPLIGYDKEEIITEARRIGAYEISILPHDDCCTLMMPKNPATRARLLDVEREEAKLDITALLAMTMQNTEVTLITPS